MARWTSFLGKDDWLVIGWAFGIKILLFLFGASVWRAYQNQPVGGVGDALSLWKRWDSETFLSLAENGYVKGHTIIGYPLYPWLVRGFSWMTKGNYFFAGLIVSALALGVGVVFFRRLVRLDYPAVTALRSVWFFLIFPTAYFLHIAYSESLFFALVCGAFFFARKKSWTDAGFCGALAAMTRANGIALFPALAVEAITQWREEKKWRWSWLSCFAVLAGYCIYLGINYAVFGDAFGFVGIRRQVFATHYTWPWVGIRQMLGDFYFRKPNQSEIVGLQELIFVVVGLAGVILAWFKLRPSYATWMTVTLLGFTSQSFIQSGPRYVLMFFPLFILFALGSKNRLCYALLTLWSLLYFALFAGLFARGWWAF